MMFFFNFKSYGVQSNQRIKYMVTDYVRTRLKKIEKHAEYALEEELVKDDQSVPHLSPAEFVYAREFHRLFNSFQKH